MMQTKTLASTTHAEQVAGTSARRSVSSVPAIGANSSHARPEAMALLHLQKNTSNSTRVKQLASMQIPAGSSQRKVAAQPPATLPGKGLPPHLKHGVESLSGVSMDEVTVHYNSPQPAQLRAHAFAQGTDIHLGPGQEAHLPHEAWHVVQQAQGRVAATTQMAGATLNDDEGLEREADVMGARALAMPSTAGGVSVPPAAKSMLQKTVLQRKAGMEVELDVPFYGPGQYSAIGPFVKKSGQVLESAQQEQIESFLFGSIIRGPKMLSEDTTRLGYTLSSDHGEYQLIHKKLQAHILRHYLGREEKELGNLTRFNMSNMEYATIAYHEDSPEHDALMERAAKGVERHAMASTAAAGSGARTDVPGVAETLYTGVPMAAFRSLLAVDDDPGLQLLNTAHAKAANPVLAYQTTVGTMPSEIPGLFKQEAKELNEFKGKATAEDTFAGERREHEARAKAIILNESLDSANQAWATIPDEFRAMFGGVNPEQALLGWMTLIAQYMISSLVDQTTYRYVKVKEKGSDRTIFRTGHSSIKNLLPYLSKVPLYASQAALPSSVRPSSASANANKLQLWKNLFDALLKICLAKKDPLIARMGVKPVTGTVLDSHNKIVPVGPSVLHGDIALWLDGVLFKNNSTNVASGAFLTVEEAVDRETKPSHDGEKAIPLEDRATKYKMRFDNAAPANASRILMNEWRRAKARRETSIASGNTRTNEIKASVSDPDKDRLAPPPFWLDLPDQAQAPANTDQTHDAGGNETKPAVGEPDDDPFAPPPFWLDPPDQSQTPANTDQAHDAGGNETEPAVGEPDDDPFAPPDIL